MKRHLTPLLVLAGAVTFACGGSEPSPAPPAPAPRATAAAPATTVPPAGSMMMAASETGVPECDEYLRKYEACLKGKVPASAKPQLEAAMQTYRQTWKAAAAQPAAKAALTTTCQQATATAKMALGAYGCQF
jgi:hypothetical protein